MSGFELDFFRKNSLFLIEQRVNWAEWSLLLNGKRCNLHLGRADE